MILLSHLGTEDRAVNATSTHRHLIKSLWQMCWQTDAYEHIRQTRSDVRVHLELSFWTPCECRSDIEFVCTVGLSALFHKNAINVRAELCRPENQNTGLKCIKLSAELRGTAEKVLCGFLTPSDTIIRIKHSCLIYCLYNYILISAASKLMDHSIELLQSPEANLGIMTYFPMAKETFLAINSQLFLRRATW